MAGIGSLLSGGSYAGTGLAYATAAVALAILLLGAAVLRRGGRAPTTLLFFVITVVEAGWLAAFALMYASREAGTAILWARIAHFSSCFISPAIFHFATTQVGKRKALRNWIFAFWSACAAIAVAGLLTPWFVRGVRRYAWGYYAEGSLFNSVWVLFFGAILVFAMRLFAKAYHRSEGAARERAGAFLLAFAVSSLAALDYLPTVGIEVYPVGYVAILGFTIIAASAIWRYQLADVTPEYAAGQILETMKGAVLVVDMQGRIRVVNRAAALLLGYRREEMRGMHIRTIIDPDSNMSTGQLLDSMGVLEGQMVWRGAQGQTIHILASSSLVRDAEGVPVAVVYVASDFGERRRAEQALRESESRYRSLFDANPLPMWIYDYETLRFIAVNEAAVHHYGFTREEFLGMTIAGIRPEDDIPQMLDAIKSASGYKSRGGFRHRKKNGAVIDVEITSLDLDQGGRHTRLVIAQDITERRRAEEALQKSEQLYRELFENATDIVYTHDLEGRFTSMNVAGERSLGYSRAEAQDFTMRDVIAPESLETALEEMRKKVRGETASTFYEIDILARDGRRVPVEVSSRLIYENGRPVGVQGIARDMTERKANEQRFRLLFERNLAGVFRGSPDGEIIECNDALARIFGFDSREELMSQPAGSRYYDPDERPRLMQQLRDQRSLTNVELRMRRRDGSPMWVLENVSLLDDGLLEGTIIDITDRKTAQEQIEYQAYHDVLTGLPNRLLFRDRIGVALAHSRRVARAAAVMFLDLDQFKLVNDTLGHTVGDGLLQAIAQRLVECVRGEDTVARMGGDEFTILLTELTDRRAASLVAQKVLDAVRRPIEVDGHELFVTTSIGIAIFPEDGTDAETLLKNADRAMYRAKEVGRNNYQYALDIDGFAGRLSLERSLRHALEREELVVHYQPMVEIATGRVVGAEALLRWEHPQNGLMPPDDFIPVAEESLLIIPLGEWVLRTACRDMKRWHDAGHTSLRVAVNLSPRQFQQRDLAAMIERVLEETGLPPSALDLEITESAAMQNAELSLAVLHRLKEMGIRISIDDFGTGYSSLNYLKRFPIDTVKIDQEFVRDLEADANSAIVSAMISMARALRLSVIAEGVETEAQRAFLLREQCPLMQGFLHSRPLPADEFAQRLSAVASGT